VLDHATGYLMAFGAAMALARKLREGGSWLVRVSLAQTAHWLTQLGRVPGGFGCAEPTEAEVKSVLDAVDTPSGRLEFIRHAARLSETPAHWSRPPVPLGTHAPVWPL
jgi:crotonobetainyl-CoA:carnitine CoA-transferase CaiB-like acyl-CoA transferase